MNKEILIIIFLLSSSLQTFAGEKSMLLKIVPLLSNLQQDIQIEECKVGHSSATRIDLSNEAVRGVYDFLSSVDPEHSFQLFLCDSEEMMWWLNNGTGVSTAIHETNHMFDFDLTFDDPPAGQAKYFLLGNVFTTSIQGTTQNYSIVGETIPEYLKTAMRYSVYIIDSQGVSGNRFEVLLDELNAYTGDAYFQLQYMESRKATSLAMEQFQIDGMVDFMVYLEYYLRSARLHYPGTYRAIASDPAVKTYIQYVWTLAENILEASYTFLENDQPFQFFYPSPGATGLDHLKTAYSDEGLAELNLLGISHVEYDHWQSTYFSYQLPPQ